MRTVTIHAAKTQLSRLIREACAGEEVVIARGSKPVVKLVPVIRREPQREFGSLRDRLEVPDEFFEPLPDDELERWER